MPSISAYWMRKLTSLYTVGFCGTILSVTAFHPLIAFAHTTPTATYRQDQGRVGTHFELSFSENDHPLLTHGTAFITVSLNDETFKFGLDQNESKPITCAVESLRCTVFIPGAISNGNYHLSFFSSSPAIQSFNTVVNVPTSIIPWWNSLEIVRNTKDFFTGSIDFVVRFTAVPPSIQQVRLGVYTDFYGNGYLDGPTEAGDLCTNEGGGSHLCTYKLDPMCTEGLGFPGCNGNDYNYYFGFNPLVQLGHSADGYHHQPSRLEEAVYFATLNYNSGWRLSQTLDMNSFQHENPSACQGQDLPYCFDVWYYTRWMQLYLADLERLMAAEGDFSVDQLGPDTRIKVKIPRLPVGSRGYAAVIAYFADDQAGDATEIPLICNETDCQSVILNNFDSQSQTFELRIYNRHPAYVYLDEHSGIETRFGDELVRKIKPSRVVNRQVFYNNAQSSWINSSEPNPQSAIDPTKTAVLPGQVSTMASYTNYVRGINGLVVDIKGATGSLNANDFEFATWSLSEVVGFVNVSLSPDITQSPLSATVTRIKIALPDNVVQNAWLRVKLKANQRTGLASTEIFYFGNAIGDMYTGNIGTPLTVRVNATDTSAVRQNQSTFADSAKVDNFYDINKDGRVNASDTSIVRQNQNASVIRMFSAPEQ
jgi:hypothetical protein